MRTWKKSATLLTISKRDRRSRFIAAARKESQARSANKLARELAYFLSGEYLAANDLSAALGRLVPAVVRGEIKPRTAGTVAYLAQTLVQTIHLAQHEYINAFGTNDWRDAIRNSVNPKLRPPQSSSAPPILNPRNGRASPTRPSATHSHSSD